MENDNKKVSSLFIAFMILVTAFLSICYAQISNVSLSLAGSVGVERSLIITNVVCSSNNNANTNASAINNYYRTILDSSITLGSSYGSSITYQVTIKNNGTDSKQFINTVYDSDFYSNNDIMFELNGLSVGDVLDPGDTVTFTITFKYRVEQSEYDDNTLNSVLNFRFGDVNLFPVVFSVEGACTFNGSSNYITGSDCADYASQYCIDTGISLFNQENYQKDFEVYFEIDEFNKNIQEGTQVTFFNDKLELQSAGYPGITYRLNNNVLEFTSGAVNNIPRVSVTNSVGSVSTVKIVRNDGILYYSINGGILNRVQDMTQFDSSFATTATFGCSKDGNGNPFRHIKGTLSNMYIKLGEMDALSVYNITYNPNGGSLASQQTTVVRGATLYSLPVPEWTGHIFVGWFTASTGGTQVTANTVPTADTTYFAQWVEESPLEEVYTFANACTFNGSTANITGDGCTAYHDVKYIDTGIKLFDENNYMKDFDIYFEIDEYNPSNQEAGQQQIFINAKYELESANWPGFVVRRRGETNDIEISSRTNGNSVSKSRAASRVTSIRVARINQKLYYSFNGEDLALLQDLTSLTYRFDTTLTIGAAVNVSTGLPFRHIKATLSNIIVELQDT